MAPRRQKTTRRGDAGAGHAGRQNEAGEETARAADQPTERRVYARAPRTWEQWDEPLRQRVVGKRVVKWGRLRISRSDPQPDS